MTNLILEESKDSISVIDLNMFMEEFNLKLPESYIEFILKNNGGYPDKSIFYSENLDLKFDIDFFYSINSSYYVKNVLESLDDLVTVNEMINNYQIEEKELESFLYPFGQNSGGTTYCISMREIDFGSILLHYWDGSDLQFITNSFTDFINRLK